MSETINNKPMKSKIWFETLWWTPHWGAWQIWRSHKTQAAAEKACERAHRERPYISFQIRKVTFVKYINAKN